ncbi:hypothetical protein D3C71_1456220 [compost metagenome]
MLQQCGNQQAANAAIAVKKRVNGFKLRVHQRNLDQRRQGAVGLVNELLHIAQQRCHTLGRRRHKHGIARLGATNPVLRAA